MFAILSIIVGIIFVLLLFSMLSSTFLELVDAIFSLRGRHLRSTLVNMLGSHSTEFLSHPIFRQLAFAATSKKSISANSLPGWINKNTFSAIVMDILNAKDDADLNEKINAMEDSELKKIMLFLHRQSNGSLDVFKDKVEHWFDEIMARATDWYKRNARFWLFFIGLGFAALFNADTIQIYKSLSANAAARDNLSSLADNFVATHDSVPALSLGTKTPQQAKSDFLALKNSYQQIVQSPLGLGWTDQEGGGNLPWILVKIAGFLLTGLAVTLGAPFWFEVLKKMITIKSQAVQTIATTLTQPAPTVTTPTVRTSVQKDYESVRTVRKSNDF